MIELWQQAVVEAFQETMRRVAHSMPYVLATLILLIVGLLAGWGGEDGAPPSLESLAVRHAL